MRLAGWAIWFVIIILISQIVAFSTVEARTSSPGLEIVVTFPNLAYDIALLLCEGDHLYSLVPQGVDPHDYQLTPEAISRLEGADVVISTAHAPFEMEIKEMRERGELEAVLVEIPEVPGIRLLENPATGQPNYHMPIYDPGNYKTFMRYIADVLANLRPGRAEDYLGKARELAEQVDALLSETPELSLEAVADLPLTQYAVSWLGVRIRFLLMKEHGVPASSAYLMRVEEAVSRGEVKLAVVCDPPRSSASEHLRRLADEHGLPVLRIPLPFSEGSILEKLSRISEQAVKLSHSLPVGGSTWQERKPDLVPGGAIAVSLLALATYLYLRRSLHPPR